MNFKKALCAMLALVAMVAMVSCNDNEGSNSDWDPTKQDLSYLDYIGIEDMDGYEFRMYCRSGNKMITDQYAEEENGDIINDAIYRRNKTVEALFNVKITAVAASDATNKANDATNAILAGDDQFDIILPHSRSAFQYAIQNTLVNFNEVTTIDQTKEWWSKDILDSANVNGYLYVLDGDISTHRLEYGFTMYFNQRFFDELGLDYTYQKAIDGEWTFDEFAKLVKQGAKDLNGDGLMNPADDQYGYYTWPAFGPIEVLYSGGQRIYSKDTQGVPKLTLNTAKTQEVFSKFFNLTKSEEVYLPTDGNTPGNLFTEGRAMFHDSGLGSAKDMRSMNDDFGILPWPKFTKTDKYSTVINGHASLVVMPITVPDYNKSGKIIEALCAVGNKEVIPAFYDVSLKTKFSRDFESEKMIDIVRESLVYDLGYITDTVFNSVGGSLAASANPDFASHYARNESRALSDLSNFLKSYGKIG